MGVIADFLDDDFESERGCSPNWQRGSVKTLGRRDANGNSWNIFHNGLASKVEL